MTKQKLLEPGVVAQILGPALGMGRQWIDFLNDCRQGRGQGAFSERLLPFACAGGSATKHSVPLYRMSDLRAFIEAVRAKSGSRHPYPLHLEVFDVPDAHGTNEVWRMRRAERSPATT
jgi:hypothetical protein